jgi:hypothetical protein
VERPPLRRRKEVPDGLHRGRPGAPRPDALAALDLPRRQQYHPSPDSWQDELVYFLLVDRFSDGAEGNRPPLDRTKLTEARPDRTGGQPRVHVFAGLCLHRDHELGGGRRRSRG